MKNRKVEVADQLKRILKLFFLKKSFHFTLFHSRVLVSKDLAPWNRKVKLALYDFSFSCFSFQGFGCVKNRKVELGPEDPSASCFRFQGFRWIIHQKVELTFCDLIVSCAACQKNNQNRANEVKCNMAADLSTLLASTCMITHIIWPGHMNRLCRSHTTCAWHAGVQLITLMLRFFWRTHKPTSNCASCGRRRPGQLLYAPSLQDMPSEQFFQAPMVVEAAAAFYS